MIVLAVSGKAYLICVLFRRKLEVVFVFSCESCEKINLSRPDFLDSEIVIWGLTSLTIFRKQVHLLLRKHIRQIAKRKYLLSK